MNLFMAYENDKQFVRSQSFYDEFISLRWQFLDNRSGQDKLAIFLAFAIKKLPIPQVTARLK